MRQFTVIRWLHSFEHPEGPFRFTEYRFGVMARTMPEACRIADEIKHAREHEQGWCPHKHHSQP